MRSRVLRVLGSLFLIGCLGSLGCNNGEVTGEQLREIFRTNVGAMVVDVGSAILEAAVEAALD